MFVAIIKSCWWNLIGNMATARIRYFGLVYASGVECGRITNLCECYLCVIKYKRYQFFQGVVDGSPAEKNALRTGSQYCVTSSPVSYTPCVTKVVGRIYVYVLQNCIVQWC